MEKKIIKCLPRKDNIGMKFWCPFCKKWHYHGRRNGNRVSHCTESDSPFYDREYKIQMMSLKELKMIKSEIEIFLEKQKSL